MFTYKFVDSNVRLALVIESFEIFDFIIKKFHVPIMDCMLNFAMRKDEVNAFGLEEIERPRVLFPLYTLHIL